MPIKIPKTLPAFNALHEENIFVMTEDRAIHQDIRPLRVAIINLMPTTIDTEIQLLRLLGNSPLQVDITLLHMKSHESKNAPPGHLEKFYASSEKITWQRFDGLIITGAPVETLEFEEVDYWNELVRVIDYSADNVFSTLHICWGAQAGLYRRYGIGKKYLPKKLFGIFPHGLSEQERHTPLFRGFDDEFLAPQSRHTESDREAARSCPALTIESETPETGIFIATARSCREIYVTGHLEYDPLTLDREYRRDLARGLPIEVPKNYYPENDPAREPVVRWRAHAHLFFNNWLNFVYQGTPYDLEKL
ncbi:MAG: homoserine O-succinyltransferase [Spirochaetaceae bacterium]|jgi:homoserine O-succinyltransferase|nr:homoserine O-succinyltransferase [Spirochaetaceae bacterium]